MRPRSSRSVQHFTSVYPHAKTAFDAGDIFTWRFFFFYFKAYNGKEPIDIPQELLSKWKVVFLNLKFILNYFINKQSFKRQTYKVLEM